MLTATGSDAAFHVLGVLAVICSIVLLLVPAKTFYHLYATNRNSRNETFVPYACMLLNCIAGFVYGCAKHERPIQIVNALGIALQVTYLALFVTFRKTQDNQPDNGARLKTVLIVSVLLVLYATVAGCFHTLLAQSVEMAVVNFAMYFAPAHALIVGKEVPVILVSVSLVNAILWTCYGALGNEADFFLIIPNATGIAMAVIQLLVNYFRAKPDGDILQ